MEVYFLASGARVTLFDPEDFEGKTGKEVKQALAAEIGASRFRQRLFLEDGAYEIPDDEILGLAVVKVALVLLDFCPPTWKTMNRSCWQQGITMPRPSKCC